MTNQNAHTAELEVAELPAMTTVQSAEYVNQLTNSVPMPAPKKPKLQEPAGTLMAFEDYSPGDFGMAERFFDLHGMEFKYVQDWKSYVHYEKGVWSRPSSNQHRNAMMRTVKRMGREIENMSSDIGDDEKAAKAIAKRKSYYEQSCTDPKLNAALNVAACFPELAEVADNFDVQPWLFNMPNGTFNIETGVVQAHNPRDLFTKSGAVNIAPKGTECPTFLNFMEEMTCGDADLKHYMLKMLGYCLTASTRERKLFMLQGTGRNGKSTLFKVLEEVMGLNAYIGVVPFSAIQAKATSDAVPVAIASMAGLRALIVNEAERGQRFNEPLVKELVSGDTQQAHFKHENPFYFTPVLKILMSTNHPVFIRSNDQAMWDRIVLIPCRMSVPKEKVDTGLLPRLLAEKEAILRLLADYAQIWMKEGLEPCQSIVDATAEYRGDMDEFGGFLTEQLENGEKFTMATAQTFEMYTKWAEDSNIKHPMRKNIFKQAMQERGYVQKHTSKGDVWVGIRAKQASELDFTA